MKKTIVFIVLILTAIFLGALIGSGVENSTAFSWLNYSKGLSLDNITLDLIILQISFGLSFHINVAQLILLLIAFFTYPKFAEKFN